MKAFSFVICLLGFSDCVTAQPVTGVYASGFEASILYPCSEPEAKWWLTTDTEFAEQYHTLRGDDMDSWSVPGAYVFVRVNGQLTETGEYGHLGAYEREFIVTEVVDITRLDSEPEGDVHEWVRGVCEENS